MIDKKITSLSSSLRYPSTSLETCLAKIRIIFEKNSTNSLSTESIVLDLGFSGKNGSSDSILASLKYYGFLEKIDNKYKVADFITDYCISEILNTEILLQALNSVPINKKIFGTYDFANLPSENEIKNFLIKTCNYKLKQATTYMGIFNKNKKLYQEQSYVTVVEKNKSEPLLDSDYNNGSQNKDSRRNNSSTITYPLSSQRQISIILPSEIKELKIEDLEDIKDILELVLKKVNQKISRTEV